MSELWTAAQVAKHLGVSESRARHILRNNGIKRVYGYPADAVLAIQRPGQGARTDLKEKAMTTTTVTLTGNLNTDRLIDGLYGWSGDTPMELADEFVEAALEEYRTIIESHTGGTWVRGFSEVIVDVDSQDWDTDELERLIEDIDLVPIHQNVCGES
jgi:hypothetical protein